MDPRGIEPLPVCLQGNLAPLVHASPWRRQELNLLPLGYEPSVQPLHLSATPGVGIEPTSKGLEALVLPLDQPDNRPFTRYGHGHVTTLHSRFFSEW
jgi:hypothetical protein